MLGLAGKVQRRIAHVWERRRQRVELSGLYAPDADDLDATRHLHEAMEWLKRAQDAGNDRGVAYGVDFGKGFDLSYPETTGYVCQTFVDQYRLTGDASLLKRAIEMADWEISIQMANGAVMGGKYNTNPTPAVFNTGMVLLGWASLITETGEERFKLAARRASDWLVKVQEKDGRWFEGNSDFALRDSTLYNVKAAWGLCEAGVALQEQRYIDAAVLNAEYCMSRQRSNGWLPECCLSDPSAPLLHTLAYSMQGLVNIGKLAKRHDLIASAQRLADAELRIMGEDGFIPGRQREDFSAAVKWCCLTGSAQTSIVWSELFLLFGDEKYRSAVRTLNGYLLAHHDIQNSNPTLRGGLPGSWPVWGEYGRLQILNWATKFLVDALTLEAQINRTAK
ncbi:MAG: hypothetical protein ABJB74_14470 [Gemmatimonas sp.]